MEYLVLFFYLKQVCSPPGTGYEAPPYFYMDHFKTLDEAAEECERKEKIGAKCAILYGYPQFVNPGFTVHTKAERNQ